MRISGSIRADPGGVGHHILRYGCAGQDILLLRIPGQPVLYDALSLRQVYG